MPRQAGVKSALKRQSRLTNLLSIVTEQRVARDLADFGYVTRNTVLVYNRRYARLHDLVSAEVNMALQLQMHDKQLAEVIAQRSVQYSN